MEKENICPCCGVNLENFNEYIDKQSFRYKQAKHDLCVHCLDDTINERQREEK